MAIWSTNGGNGKTQKHQTVQIEQAIRSSNESDDFVLDELRKINTKMEMMIGGFNRMLHDRGKELDRSFNGGFCELGDVGHRDHRVEIEKLNGVIGPEVGRIESSFDRMANQIRCSTPIITSDQTRPIDLSFKGGCDSQFEGSSMESGTSRHPFMANLIRNGDSKASRQQTSNGSESLEAKTQAMWNLANRSQIGDDDPMIAGFHGAICKPEVQLSDFEANDLKFNSEHANFGVHMAIVEMEDVVVEAEGILVDKELGNAGNGMKGGTDNGINGNEVGTGDSFVARKRNGEVAGEMVMLHEKINGDVAGTEVDHSELEVDVQNLEKEVPKEEHEVHDQMRLDLNAKNVYWKQWEIEHLKVKRINGDFEDPFDVSPNSVQTQKIQLVLAVGIAMSLVEINCWLVVGSMVCMEVMRFQAKGVVGIGVQWWRRGVG